MKLLNFIFLFLCVNTFAFSQSIDQSFFENTDQFFKEYTADGLVNYLAIKQGEDLESLIAIIEQASYAELDPDTKKAYLINAYNLLVIHETIKGYPTSSVQDIPGFFDRKKIKIAGREMTLNDMEKKEILKEFDDPRLHFVLVCGALGCPPITNFAYQGSDIDNQINSQTKKALNNPEFIKVEDDKLQLSQIFKWYAEDFGNSKSAIISFINNYSQQKYAENISVNYYNYDWTLNAASTSFNASSATPANAGRYIVSSTIPQGQIELKIFNNLYSEVIGDNRATFMTSSASFLYGINRRFNFGFNTRYRRVLNNVRPSSPFDVISDIASGSFRQGVTAFGPQIRYAPKPDWPNFSIQSSFVFPIGKDLSGGNGEQYIDWAGPSFYNQFFNDLSLGTRFSLFTDIGLNWEDIGKLSNGRINQVSTPLTAILSFSPTANSILYALGGFTPYYRLPFDYFIQGGFGGKYQFTKNVELELLYTGFTNKYLIANGGGAATYNIGFRFNI
ncbi:DUF547 domain-containing protein [Portibacter lacus]|uniref:DUF547 domain-containing protein n=1 Tax=Portibacter lacus TaxID=1099794 RepID=A0AA37WCF0_9BACT|nr:DUF547 domain-containing protein [Portibacter lacus]GLR16436.1 hypothetical protein GCM10007940_10510 [Portibacter lacus]